MTKRLAGILMLLILIGTLAGTFVSAQIPPQTQQTSQLAQSYVSSKPVSQETSKNPLDAFKEAPKILGVEVPFFFEVKGFFSNWNKPITLESHTYGNGDTLTVTVNPKPNFRTLSVSPNVEFIFIEKQSNLKFSTKFHSLGNPMATFSSNVAWSFG